MDPRFDTTNPPGDEGQQVGQLASSASVASEGATSRIDRLGQQLAGDDTLSLEGNTLIHVIIHRATHLDYGSTLRTQPAASVRLGIHHRMSARAYLLGDATVFDLVSQLPFSGESHLIFEVFNCGELLAMTFIPMATVLSTGVGVMRRALPLLTNGRTSCSSEQAGPDAVSELFVTIRVIHEAAGPEQQVSLTEARRRCAQVRVTVRSLQLLAAVGRNSRRLRPYVRAAMGVQSRCTPVAYSATQRNVEEFVFVHPNKFDCFGLTEGCGDTYEGVPRPPLTGTMAVPGYRKTVDGNIHIVYRNVRFSFWYINQENLHLEVLDRNSLQSDIPIASVSIDFDDLVKHAYGNTDTLPSFARTGVLREAIMELESDSSSGSPQPAGEIELEVAFFQDPLAVPSPLEELWRNLSDYGKEAEEKHMSALQGVLTIEAAAAPFGGVARVFQEISPEIRAGLADLLTTAAIARMRSALEHEEDGVAERERLVGIIHFLGTKLGLAEEHLGRLERAAHNAINSLSLQQVASVYTEMCTAAEVHKLLPLTGLTAELIQQHDGYGARLRIALADAVTIVTGEKIDHGYMFPVLERYLSLTLPNTPITNFGSVDARWPSANEVFNLSRELFDEQMENIANERARMEMALRRSAVDNFLPNIDLTRLTASSKQGPAPITPGSAPLRTTGSVSMGTVAGGLGGWGIAATANLIHKIDEDVFCNEKYQTELGLMKSMCNFMHSTNIDEAAANFFGTKYGFITFFFIYWFIYSRDAYQRFSRRFAEMRELCIERIGPPLSRHAFICASGYLKTSGDLFGPWEVMPSHAWTYGQVYAVRYETATLLALGQALTQHFGKYAEQSVSVLKGAISCTNPVTFSQYILETLSYEIDDLLDIACLLAAQAGRRLAHYLVSSARHRVSSGARNIRPMSLVGFSSGAVLIHACLEELRTIADTGREQSLVASNLICNVFLFGCPVPLGRKEDWTSLRHLVSGRFVNGYMALDPELLSLQYRRGCKYIGCNPLLEAPGIENTSLHSVITSHSQYADQMPAILALVM